MPELIGRWLFEGTREPFSLNGVIARDYIDCGARRILAAFQASVTDSVLEELPRVQAPTLVVRGRRDAIATQRWCDQIVSRLPHGQLVLVPEAAHAMNYASPDVFARAIEAFVRDSAASEPRRETAA